MGGHDEPGRAAALLQRLQFLTRLESYRLSGRDGDLRTGARVAPGAAAPLLHREGAKAAQFDATVALHPTMAEELVLMR